MLVTLDTLEEVVDEAIATRLQSHRELSSHHFFGIKETHRQQLCGEDGA